MRRLMAAGHDVATVHGQGPSGANDERIFHVCVSEPRVLVTLHTDFAQVIRFRPEASSGIGVLGMLGRATMGMIDRLLDQLLANLGQQPLEGKLWIVELGRIRIHSRDPYP